MRKPSAAPSDRTRLRRSHERGRYDRASLHAVLDATPLCHVGYLMDGKPAVTPTLHWREGDYVYWHGSSASRALRAAEGLDVCLTVTLLDGLVLARSAFHHSVNYRSAMLFGRASIVVDPDEKAEKLKNFVEAIVPDRWDSLRPMTAQEVKATTILSIPIDEASAKVREGGPIDDEDDYALPIWAGTVPFETVAGDPIPDPRNLAGVSVPDYLTGPRLERR